MASVFSRTGFGVTPAARAAIGDTAKRGRPSPCASARAVSPSRVDRLGSGEQGSLSADAEGAYPSLYGRLPISVNGSDGTTSPPKLLGSYGAASWGSIGEQGASWPGCTGPEALPKPRGTPAVPALPNQRRVLPRMACPQPYLRFLQYLHLNSRNVKIANRKIGSRQRLPHSGQRAEFRHFITDRLFPDRRKTMRRTIVVHCSYTGICTSRKKTHCGFVKYSENDARAENKILLQSPRIGPPA